MMDSLRLVVLVAGVFFALGGIILVARTRTIARIVARKAHAAPLLVASLFLVRPRPATVDETTQYLSEIYRFIGVIWAVGGLFIIWAALFGKPAPP